MSIRLILVCFVICFINLSSVVLAQDNTKTPKINLTLEGKTTESIALDEKVVSAFTQHTLKVKDHNGQDVSYSGVALYDILKGKVTTFGENLRGKNLTFFLLVEAKDGYKAVFSLTELDPAFTDQIVLLANKKDGKLLSESEGEFRLIVPYEKRQARWVRQVVSIKVLKAGD